MTLINAIKIKNILLLLILIYPNIILAVEEDNKFNVNSNKEAWTKDTKNYLSNLRSVSGDFSQIDNIGNVSKGIFWISKSGEVAFYYNSPSETRIIYKEGTLYFKESLAKNYQNYKIENNPISLFLNNDEDVEKFINKAIIDNNIGKFKVNLNRNNERNSLMVILDYPSPILRQWKFIDQQKKETNVFFSNIRNLENISEEYFDTN
ncbi:MAG: LolA family protein [Alphaproteobacteria bacterium]|jgi:outer membrane lipoprotein-sorting protein|tara:strand:+ start:5960 stop:6577 length:618 start_codon:yes stop_codon:yes gene_type:complete